MFLRLRKSRQELQEGVISWRSPSAQTSHPCPTFHPQPALPVWSGGRTRNCSFFSPCVSPRPTWTLLSLSSLFQSRFTPCQPGQGAAAATLKCSCCTCRSWQLWDTLSHSRPVAAAPTLQPWPSWAGNSVCYAEKSCSCYSSWTAEADISDLAPRMAILIQSDRNWMHFMSLQSLNVAFALKTWKTCLFTVALSV